jgi:hypothetical protein
VFYDDSGTRAVAIQWTGRASILLGALVCLALTASLGAHVSLPGLERLNPFAALSQRSDASRNADQDDAVEPRPTQIVDETAGRLGTERALAIAPHSTSTTEKVAKLDAQRSAVRRSGTNARVVGSPRSTPGTGSGRTADATPPGRQAVAAPATLPRRAHADRGKSNEAKSADHSAKPSTHPASRVAAAKSKHGAQARTQSVKAAEASSPSKRKPPPGKAKP